MSFKHFIDSNLAQICIYTDITLEVYVLYVTNPAWRNSLNDAIFTGMVFTTITQRNSISMLMFLFMTLMIDCLGRNWQSLMGTFLDELSLFCHKVIIDSTQTDHTLQENPKANSISKYSNCHGNNTLI